MTNKDWFFFISNTQVQLKNFFPDGGSVKIATSECMMGSCHEPAEHHLELHKHSPLWGTYQLKDVNIADMKHLEICEDHMNKEIKRHTWALNSMAKLTVQNQDCYLCKKKRVYTNTTRHCVKHMISVAGEVCHVPCDFFDTNEGHFVHSRHSSNHFVHSRHSSNHFICHSCKGTYEEIRELEKQHQKYLFLIFDNKVVYSFLLQILVTNE